MNTNINLLKTMRNIFFAIILITFSSCSNMEADAEKVCDFTTQTTEMMPEIRLYHRLSSGQTELVTPCLPKRQPHAFHANLADHLLWGEPLAAPLADSVKVVAILEAAARSMANRSSWEGIDDE